MGVLRRLMPEAVKDIDPGFVRALGAPGGSPTTGFLHGILPSAFPCFDCVAVSATLLTYILLTWIVDLLSAAVRRDLR